MKFFQLFSFLFGRFWSADFEFKSLNLDIVFSFGLCMKCEMSIMPAIQSVRSAVKQKNLSFSFSFNLFCHVRFPGSDSQISSYSQSVAILTPQTSGLRDFIRNTRQTGNLSSPRQDWRTQVGSRPIILWRVVYSKLDKRSEFHNIWMRP